MFHTDQIFCVVDENMMDKTLGDYFQLRLEEFLKELYGNEKCRVEDIKEIRDKQHKEDLYALGYYNFTIGNHQKAIVVFELLTKFYPENHTYWKALGACYQDQQEFSKAIKYYEIALKIDNLDIAIQTFYIECLLYCDRKEEAKKQLEQLFEIEEKSPISFSLQNANWFQKVRTLYRIHFLKDEEFEVMG